METAKALVPEPLEVRIRDGETWVAVVPFRMDGIGWRSWPGVPGLRSFPEINVRLYVEHEGRPGVWFLSLEANRRLAAAFARRFFHLPYHFSQIDFEVEARSGRGETRIESRRSAADRQGQVTGRRLVARYRPDGPVEPALPGSLEEWLTDLRRLYALGPDGELYRSEVDHGPWPLQVATTTIATNDLLSIHGIDVSSTVPEHVLYSRRHDVRLGSLEPVATGQR